MKKAIIAVINLFLVLTMMVRFGLTMGTLLTLALSIGMWGMALLYDYQKTSTNRLIKIIWKVVLTGFTLMILASIFTLSLINTEVYSTVEDVDTIDYALILGAGLNGDQVSNRLKLRLDTAYDLLWDNDIKIIVSGGQGPDELISEAQAMASYLIERGIDTSRIILEDQSTSTRENILFSHDQMSGESQNVAIITSDYHMYRAKMLGRRQGWTVQGASGINPISTRANYMVREVFALLKDMLKR